MMQHIETEMQKPGFMGSKLTSGGKAYIVKLADNYSYIDPVDGSQASKQVMYDSICSEYGITKYRQNSDLYPIFYITGFKNFI